jgi:hypothetical protein
MDATSSLPKNPLNYSCIVCDFLTCNKKDYKRHLLTNKHKNLTNPNDEHPPTPKEFKCKCEKVYKHSSTLSRHKRTCSFIHKNAEGETDSLGEVENKQEDNNNELITLLITQNNQLQELLIKQSQEYQKQLIELIPKLSSNNNNTINSNNKVDINIFLNEKCKDAMTMNEFIKKIDVSINNLFMTKDKGLAEGISNLFIENIKKLSLHERPLHCTDVKRETLYIKNDTWEKDDKKTFIKNAIKRVSIKQSKSLTKFKEEKPNYMNNQKDKDDFINIVRTTTESLDDKEDKVIRNLCKSVYLKEEDYKN